MSEENHRSTFIFVAVKELGKPLELVSVESTKIESWINNKFPEGERNFKSNVTYDIACVWKEGTNTMEPVDPTVERFVKKFFLWEQDKRGPRGTVIFYSAFGDSISDEAYDWLETNLK